MKEAEMQQKYSPGEEPVTTDDLIFQLGEKEVDLYRKQKAIKNLISKIQELYRLVEEKNSKVVDTDNIEKKRRDVLNTLSEKDQEIKELYNQVDEYKKTVYEKDEEIKNLNDKLLEQNSEIQEKMEEERDKVRKLRRQLKTEQRET